MPDASNYSIDMNNNLAIKGLICSVSIQVSHHACIKFTCDKERRRDIIFIKSCNVLTFAEQNKKNLPRFQKSLNIFRSKKEKSLKFTHRDLRAPIFTPVFPPAAFQEG